MTLPQFDRENSIYDWFSLTYQSNNDLNDALKNQAKHEIVERILQTTPVVEICSYIHCHIVFAVKTENSVILLDDLILALRRPLVHFKPDLLFSLNLIAKSQPPSSIWLYIYGDSSMNDKFLASISDIYP
ncbi:MAG: hypothetical protein Q8K60_03395 [Parachlamydiaceae bacterium]|nr:hypothetical protein [Parachlamydiaceae bacterium]